MPILPLLPLLTFPLAGMCLPAQVCLRIGGERPACRCTLRQPQVDSDGVVTVLAQCGDPPLAAPRDSTRITDATFTVVSGPESSCEENSVILVAL